MSAADIASHFFQAYAAAPVVLACYVAYKWWAKTRWVRIEDMDLITGRRELNLPELLAEERAELRSWPRWKRAYKVVC